MRKVPWSGMHTGTAIWRSQDEGRTWSKSEPVCRGCPACAEKLSSGRVLLVYGFRFEKGFGLRARVLASECDEVGEEFILRDDGAVADFGVSGQLPAA